MSRNNGSLRFTKGMYTIPLRHCRSPHRASDGGSEGTASHDPLTQALERRRVQYIDNFPAEVCEME